jgi:tetratricopeptide (TPR) repeat protein
MTIALRACGALLLSTACHAPVAPPATAPSPFPAGAQAISFLGDTLRTLPLSLETRERYERQLAEARAAYERAPTNADSIIWFGRRLAYLGRFREAIDVYSRGIQLHPDDARLYRHRGHRYISVRELDRAIADLERGTRLVAGSPDIVEPDGQPNARNMPIGTLHSNIAYHLGLAYYLKGDHARAVPVYERELAEARNDDRRVSTAYWLYMSLRRLGRDREAEQVLAPIRREMQVVENDTYRRLLLLFKGELPVDSVLRVEPGGEMFVTDATAAYGVANWHFYNGRRAEHERVLKRIVAAGQWGAFGYVAAEVDLGCCQARSVAHEIARRPEGDSAAVVAVVQRLFDAMAARDTAAARALLLPGTRFVSMAADTSVAAPRIQVDSAFLRMLGTSRERLLERMWSPVVQVQGSIATVWTPYDFHVDGRWSHCGIDTVTLLRVGQAWRIAALVYTVQRRGCAPSPLGAPAP